MIAPKSFFQEKSPITIASIIIAHNICPENINNVLYTTGIFGITILDAYTTITPMIPPRKIYSGILLISIIDGAANVVIISAIKTMKPEIMEINE